MFLRVCIFFFWVSNILSAAVIVVPPPPADIQSYIDAASDGDTIELSAGTYVQEIHVISKNLNIIGQGEGVTVIQAPPPTQHLVNNFVFGGTTFYSIVMVDNQAAPTPQTVNISNLTVDGDAQQDTVIPPIYGNSNRFFAIGYHNAGGTVDTVHTTNTKQNSNFNELAGGGIVNASNQGAVNFTVNNCLIDFFQRLGIDCRGASLTADISNNTVTRGFVIPPPAVTATPNGIQFSGLATGSITNNVVSQNIASVAGAQATGILAIGAGANLVISGNTANDNDLGIVSINSGDNLIVSNNTVNFTTTPGPNPPEGIAVQDTNGLSTINSNIMNNIPFINMELISTANNPFHLSNNQFLGSQTGLLVTGAGATGPVITMDSDVFSGTSGFFIQEVQAPNDIWPSTATVSFDGLIAGNVTFAQFQFLLTKIYDKHNDPALGLVIAFLVLPPTNFSGAVRTNRFLNCTEFFLLLHWSASPTPNVHYEIFKNGVLIATLPNGATSYLQKSCVNNFSGTYTIIAVDPNGNTSVAEEVVIP